MQLNEKEVTEFQAWLTANTKLQGKSKGDVLSRIRRLPIKVTRSTTDSSIASKVSDKAADLGLSVFVTSQLKRAYRLYRDFLKDSEGKCS